MSYILDALKKADAERSRGQVPQLMDQPATTPQADAPLWRRPALIAGVALLVVLVAAGAWWKSGRNAPPAPVPTTIAPATPAAATGPTAPSSAATTSAPMTPSAPMAPMAPMTPVAPAAPVAVSPVAPAPAREAAPLVREETPPVRARAAASPPDAARLPDGAGVGAPPVQVGFSRYEPEASRRRLMLDGAVLREGDLLAPGHRLISIGVRSAVLEWQGARYRIQY